MVALAFVLAAAGLDASIISAEGRGNAEPLVACDGVFASRADLASRGQQITIANKVYDRRGGASGDWACARKLGIG